MRPMNGAKPNARDLIERIMADERFQASSHFSDRVYRDEPILTTGRAMASYLPDRYRAMRSISRNSVIPDALAVWITPTYVMSWLARASKRSLRRPMSPLVLCSARIPYAMVPLRATSGAGHSPAGPATSGTLPSGTILLPSTR